MTLRATLNPMGKVPTVVHGGRVVTEGAAICAYLADAFAAAVTRQPFIAGTGFSAADVYVGSHILWGMQFGALPKRAEFEDYAARLVTRPAHAAAKAIDTALGEQLAFSSATA